MDTPAWFDDLPVLGEFSRKEAIAALKDAGDDETVTILEVAAALDPSQYGSSSSFGDHTSPRTDRTSTWWPFSDKPWQYTSHTYGYLASSTKSGQAVLPIRPLSTVHANPKLRNTRVKITLNRLYVEAYPGRKGDTHLILVHFFARDQLSKKTGDMYFNIACEAANCSYASIHNYPIFVGLNVGSEGLVFGGFTINVKNEADTTFLKFLQSDVFKTGLELTKAAQPVLAPFLTMAKAIAEVIVTRNQKRLVQKAVLGLDFRNTPLGAPLAEGTYVAVQVPGSRQTALNWEEWVYHKGRDKIVKHDNHEKTIPFNHFIFSIDSL